MARGVLLGKNTAAKVVRLVGDKATSRDASEVIRRDVGSEMRFFRLLEDFVDDGPAWADWVSREDNTSRGTMKVYCHSGILDGAQAGYKGVVTLIDDEWVAPVLPCKVRCVSGGSISGTPPIGGGDSDGAFGEGGAFNEVFMEGGAFGEDNGGAFGEGGTFGEGGAFNEVFMGSGVGEPYSFVPTVVGIDPGSITATGLPPGLSINSTTGEISGTPTEAGSFGVTVTGTSPKTGGAYGETCTITKYFVITIEA
jgi:hypothetical protein